jgi:hypothetical protein
MKKRSIIIYIRYQRISEPEMYLDGESNVGGTEKEMDV